MCLYVICCFFEQTSNPNFRNTEWSVERRYSDFEWLRTKLCSAFRGTIVPPMPEKSTLSTLPHVGPPLFDLTFLLYPLHLLSDKYLSIDPKIDGEGTLFSKYLSESAWLAKIAL